MKILNTEEYISEKLNIQPIVKNDKRFVIPDIKIDDDTMSFINDYELVWNANTKLFDCKGDVVTDKRIIKDGKLKIRFGTVNNFMFNNDKITTLEGAPLKVNGNFYCERNEIESLEGAPKEVNGNFYCYYNKLTTLEGAPQKVGGSFYCNNNTLNNLIGAPIEVGKNFCCSGNFLRTLEGAPQKVGGDFDCSANPLLKSLNGKPKHIDGKFIN